MRLHLTRLAAAMLLACSLPLQAADTPEPPKPKPKAAAAAPVATAAAAPAATPAVDPLGPARARIAAKEWPQAVDALIATRDDRNADWHNLIGFALRNLPAADYPVAEHHYNEALRINPMHRGALEYSGELYLLTGQRAKAEQRLAALAKACPAGCPELDDLKASVAKQAKP